MKWVLQFNFLDDDLWKSGSFPAVSEAFSGAVDVMSPPLVGQC